MPDVVAGIFVGGASRRMGGQPKGLLEGPKGATLIDRWRTLFAALAIDVVLVGRRREYAQVEIRQLADAPAGIGPIGGLAALLAHAGTRRAIAVACDMPFVTADDVRALLATEGTAAPRRDGRWEPLCAIYAPGASAVVQQRIAAGERSLQGLLDALSPIEVALPSRHLDDWDAPEDVSEA